MNVRIIQLRRVVKVVLFILLLSIAGMTKAQNENITFTDAIVKAYCVANWDTDGDGELNQAEAAAVTSLDGVFMFDDGITSFNELQFFIGLTSFGEDEFNSCTSLATITIPNAVTSIGNYAFSDCSSLTLMTSYACTPPALGNDVFYNVPSVLVLNVPCHTFAMYQEADGWSDFSNYEEFEYGLCPIPFADANVKAICVAHWDTNEDGELSYAEAAVVINLGTYFKSTNITSFDELEYFTSLTSLPNTAFYGCTSLASIALPASVSALGNGSFYNCTSLATMTIYAETPPTVGTNAFKNVSIDMAVYVPCGNYAAYHTANGWSEFTILQQSGSCPIVFADSDVKALCVANWDTNGDGELSYDEAAAVTNLGVVFNYNSSSITSFNELQYFINLTSIGNSAFSGCTGLTSIVIPNSVTSIGNYAFQACTSLTSIEIPSSLSSIGNYAFVNCTSLTSIEIPNSVTSIGSGAFGSCSNLTSIEIPMSVTAMGDNPFYSCSSLEQIVVASNNPYFDSREDCNAIIVTDTNVLVSGCKNTVIPSTVTSIGNWAFYSCSSLASIVIPNSVTSIGSSAFFNCSSLASIVIPNSMTSIDDNPFADCSGLEQIEVASDNAYYDSRENCNAIIRTNINALVTGCKNTVIPNSITLIGNQAFTGCSSLTSVEIPNSVTSIGSGAFSFCTGLISVEIPNSVTSIGSGAFSFCTGLISVASFANTPPTLVNNVFSSVNKFIPVYVPCSASNAYQSTNGWNEFTNIKGMCPGSITVAALPTEGGTVSGGGLYEGGGATCTLTATANHDYHFLNWTENGEVVSYEAEYTFLVAGDRNLVANFSFTLPAPVVAEYYPDPNEPNSPYVKVHWAEGPYEAMIGDVNSTINTAYMPFYTYYNYSISEALYKTNELIGSGATAGLITSLSWEAIEVTTIQPQYNISIYMANVPDTELTTTSHLASDMTLVYTGNIGIPSLGWNEFVFNESNFVWDGTSNILILCQRNNGQWNGRVSWRSHNPDFYGMAYDYQDNTPYNADTQTYALTLSNTTRPNIIMKGEGSMTYNLYRTNCDGTGAQLIAENLNEPQFIDETWLQLENDSYKYGVSVADSTSTDIFWSNCIENNFNPAAFHFITTGNWSTASNWQEGTLPGADDIVFINAPCQLDQDAEVAVLVVAAGQTLTVQSGKTLTVNGLLSNTSTAGLAIKDGAQLINASGNVAATLEKDITAYSDSNPDAWYTIASPMDEMPIEGSSFATPEFDLYRYNESNLTNEEWENYKGGLADFTTFENGRGYLFANSNAFSPAFTGTLNASAVTRSLSYTERPNDPLSGFNLIGNPFPHDIYKGEGAAIDNANLASGYYTLTNEGTWQVHTFEDAIHPGQGILVKATAPTILTIAKSTAIATAETGGAKRETSPLSISVEGENGQDQAFVYFGRGNSMEKMDGFVAQEPSLWVRDSGKDYAIAHVEKACETLELCFNCQQTGDFTLTVDRNETEFEYLQLVDHVTGLTVDLLKQHTYGFHATGQEPDARFSIRFKVTE